MAWTTPGTATAGSVLTASFWNEQVRDNMVELAPFSAAWTSHAPTVTSSSGTFTSVSCSAKYVKVGKLVVWTGIVTVTTAGTAAGNMYVPLPVTPSATLGVGAVAETATGASGLAVVDKANNRASIARYDAATLIATGRTILFSVTYEAA